jgi:rhodanese-related sulfurtransferase
MVEWRQSEAVRRFGVTRQASAGSEIPSGVDVTRIHREYGGVKTMKILFVWLATALVVFGETKKVDVAGAEKLIADKVQILDVRTDSEWNEGHLEGAVRVDYLEPGFAENVVKAVDPKKPVLVYCRSGNRSGKASKAMQKLGFVEISDLKGGIAAWKKAGKKVVK